MKLSSGFQNLPAQKAHNLLETNTKANKKMYNATWSDTKRHEGVDRITKIFKSIVLKIN